MKLRNQTVSGTTVALLILSVAMFATAKGIEAPKIVIQVVDVNTGSNSTTLGSANVVLTRAGLPFSVKILLNGAIGNLTSYSVAVAFDNSTIRCSAVSLPRNDASWVFFGRNVYEASYIENFPPSGHPPEGIIAAILKTVTSPVSVQGGSFAIMNFTALKTGNTTLSIYPLYSPYIDPSISDTDILHMEGGTPVDTPYNSESFTVTVVAAPSPPIPSFGFSPTEPKINQTIDFDASSSYDPDGNITTYVWDFGDNTNVTTSTPLTTHEYGVNAPYSVKLTVYDNDGFSVSTTRTVQVGFPPIANFTYTPKTIISGQTVTFNATESTARNNAIITAYIWNFGDDTNDTTSDPMTGHTYQKRGVYQVNLTVVDSVALFNSTIHEVTVGIPPVVNFTYEPAKPRAFDAINFTAIVTLESGVPGLTVVSHVWDFGEGLPAITTENATIAHIYESSEGYNITLTVYDNDGLHASITKSLYTLEANTGSPDYTWYIVVAVIIAVVVIAAAVVIIKRRRQRASAQTTKHADRRPRSSRSISK